MRTSRILPILIFLVLLSLAPIGPAAAQKATATDDPHDQHLHPVAATQATETRAVDRTIPISKLSDRAGWPEPVGDRSNFGLMLFDTFEFQSGNGPDALRWDLLGWHGGDYERLWIKSEGRKSTSPAQGSEVELQLLYGRLISPYFDAQFGIRFDQRLRRGSHPGRAYAVLGFQGIAPYRFDIEPTLFLSNKGQLSGRLKATYDLLLTQRLFLQPRLETNVALQKDEDIGVGAGLNDLEVGARLRYEIRREFAPYVGVTWKESIGATHQLTVREGGDPRHLVVAIGVRAWF